LASGIGAIFYPKMSAPSRRPRPSGDRSTAKAPMPAEGAEFYSPREFARIVRIGLNQVYGLIERGEIHAARLGGQYRVPAGEVARLRGDNLGTAATVPVDVLPRRVLAMSDQRFTKLVSKLFALGVRPVAELLNEIRAGATPPAAIEDRIEIYVQRLSPDLLALTGGDRLPPAPIHAVPSQ
jgi:excisionase family DNA binding protein